VSGGDAAPQGVVLAVCAARTDVVLDGIGRSGIDKRPESDRVAVGVDGLVLDHSCDTKHHGGGDQAVYAYDDAEAKRWAGELGRDLPYGWFGENLRIAGMPITDAFVGERWEIGDDGLLLETTIPRTPCRTFAVWSGEPKWVKRFMQRADVGAYLRVLQPGSVGIGDEVRVVHTPAHGVRVRHLITGTDADSLSTLLSAPDIAPKVRREATRHLARA
jgi:MOSC domain-containing protein YiiM